MQTLPESPENPSKDFHWSYGALFLMILIAPFLMVFSFGLPLYSCAVWLLLLCF
jgi:hypothetical protein